MFITVTHCTTSKEGACRIKMRAVSTNFAKTLVCKREYDVIL